ncbi:hypothetical protein PoB_001459200 [Plakobranchus ocellatus]|uniref:Uncharacterized protein n=1 Tax=Plakobranchus ocellatus TaxID=259542 RepID=A0AAV3Z0S7_9GAST|nr:hypothetical protein PoB_001459200 [Plakobranchus ocellatus]
MADSTFCYTTGTGATVDSKHARRSAGILLSRVRAPSSAPWLGEGLGSLRSNCSALLATEEEEEEGEEEEEEENRKKVYQCLRQLRCHRLVLGAEHTASKQVPKTQNRVKGVRGKPGRKNKREVTSIQQATVLPGRQARWSRANRAFIHGERLSEEAAVAHRRVDSGAIITTTVGTELMFPPNPNKARESFTGVWSWRETSYTLLTWKLVHNDRGRRLQSVKLLLPQLIRKVSHNQRGDSSRQAAFTGLVMSRLSAPGQTDSVGKFLFLTRQP